MKIYSELTNKEYATVDACVADEEKYLKEQEAEKLRKAELAENRKARAKEVEEAMKVAAEVLTICLLPRIISVIFSQIFLTFFGFNKQMGHG